MIKQRIDASPRLYSATLGLLVAFIGVVKYGIDIFPGWINLFTVSQNLTEPRISPILAGDQDYILSSSTSAVILGLIPGSNQFIFVTGSVTLTFIALFLPFLSPRISLSKNTSRLLFIFIAGSALLPLLLTWIGSYDPVTVIGITLALGFHNRLVSIVGWIIAGFNHSPLGSISLIAVGVIYWSVPHDDSMESRIKPILIGLIGLLIGILLNTALMSYWGGVTSRWELFRNYDLSFYVNNTIAAMPVLIFSALGVGWLVLLRPSWLKHTATKSLVTLGIIAPVLASLTTLDQSRVTAVALFAPIFAFTILSTQIISPMEVRRVWKNLALAAAVIPIPVFHMGSLEQNGWQSILSWTTNFS